MKKSKFLTFMASFIPGLGQFYLGYIDRALIFFALVFLSVLGTAGLCWMSGSDEYFVLLVFALPVIWFIALIDALSLVEKVNLGAENPDTDNGMMHNSFAGLSMNNRKIIAVIFSMIPGAGHMYLGLLREGVQFMAVFFFTAFLMGWLNLSLLAFILPVIWFYSLFDAYHRVDGSDNNTNTKWEEVRFLSWMHNHPHWIGWGLIIFGFLIIFEKMLAPMISWQIRHYIQTGIVAVIFILGGIKLLGGSKVSEHEDEIMEAEENTTSKVDEAEVDNTCESGE